MAIRAPDGANNYMGLLCLKQSFLITAWPEETLKVKKQKYLEKRKFRICLLDKYFSEKCHSRQIFLTNCYNFLQLLLLDDVQNDVTDNFFL